MDATVIITIYNCSIDELKETLSSVCNQRNIKFEILFADDCSNINYKEIIDAFMDDNGISYEYFRNDTNVGTVKNVLNAAYHAKADYIKPLGCGDTFYSDTSLATYIHNFGDNDILYGKLQGVIDGQEGKRYTKYKNPLYLKPFYKGADAQLNSLIVLGDHLSGAGLMYEKSIFIRYLEKIQNRIIYVEDFIPMFVLLDGGKLKVLNQKVIKYSLGTGISTRKTTDTRILKDAYTFDDICLESYPHHPIIKKYKKFLEANSNPNKIVKLIKKTIIEPRFLIIRIMKTINKRNMRIAKE